MFAFSEEELVEISKYPKLAIEYANKKMGKILLEGGTISAPFKLFCSLAGVFVRDNQSKIAPSTGRAGANQQGKVQQTLSARQATQKEDEKWMRTNGVNFRPGLPVITHPSHYQPTIKIVETDEEFAVNLERTLHDRILAGTINPNAGTYPNPFWDKLTAEQQYHIKEEIHVGCTCRKYVDDQLKGALVDFSQLKKAHNQAPQGEVYIPKPLPTEPVHEIPEEVPYFSDDSVWEEVF